MLRPWRIAGITHFLGDVLGEYAELADSAELAAPRTEEAPPLPSSCPPAQSRHASAAPSPAPATQPQQAPPAAAQASNAPAHGARPPIPRPGEAQKPASAAAQAIQAAEYVSHPRPWEEPWESLAGRFTPAPLLWTYSALGQDLLGDGDKSRSACLRDIIGRLQLPKGSSTFWPLLVPNAPEPVKQPGTSYFREGLALLRPQAVVMIGADAPESSGLPIALRTPFTQEIFQGRFYLLLPDFDILRSRQDMLDKACIFLRTTLSGLPAFLTR